MPTPTYTLIQEQVLGSNSNNLSFSNIPQTYKDLYLEISGGTQTGAMDAYIQFNGDTAANYSCTALYGYGTGQSSSRYTNNIYLDVWGGGTAGSEVLWRVNIMSYSSSSIYKTLIGRHERPVISTEAIVGLWRSTSAITSINVKTTNYFFSTGTAVRLWGIIG